MVAMKKTLKATSAEEERKLLRDWCETASQCIDNTLGHCDDESTSAVQLKTVGQLKHKRDASIDCTPKNHAKPAWKRLRRLSVEETLPAGLHMLAERQVQDGNSLTAEIDAKSNASETSLCSDSNSWRSSFVLADRQTEGRNDFEAVDKDKGNTSEPSLSCDEAWPQCSFVSKDNENEGLPELILFEAVAGHYRGTKFTTPV